jgi:FkbM family methyltransferase
MVRYSHKLLQLYARHFPVHRGKHRVVNAVAKYFPARHGKYLTSLKSAPVSMYCDISKYIQREIFFFGEYEHYECVRWIELARNSALIFDVGANIGLYSLLAASVNPKAAIHAFEPTPELINAISENVRVNHVTNINVNQVAVGSVSGNAYLHSCKGEGGTNEGMNYVTSESLGETDEVTATVSIDDYCRDRNISSIDLMKMDIEGGEYDALLGARRMLDSGAIKCLFIELVEWAAQRSGHTTRDIMTILLESGYKVFAIREPEAELPLDTSYVGNAIAIPARLFRTAS